MRKFAIIVYCFYGNLLVSAIQLNQILPTQPCPCNENNYQGSLNVPALLQQANIPQQLIQQSQIFDIYKQPSNNNLYPQQILAQNDFAIPYKQQINFPNNLYQYPVSQPTHPITNQISQLYMNKILSNPMVQGILDSNIRLYNPPFLELPNQMPSNILPSQGNVPHVVNNYFILPPEVLNINEETNTPKHNHGYRIADKNTNIPRRGNGNRRKQSNKQGTDDTHNYKRRLSNRNDNFSNNQNKRGKSRSQNDHHNMRVHSEEDRKKSGGIRKYNRNLSVENTGENHQHTECKRSGKSKSKRLQISDKEAINTNEENTKIISRLKEKSNYNIDEPAEITESKKLKERKKSSRDKEVIEDFRKKFPGIPEDVVRSLLSYLRRQLENQQLGQSPIRYPDLTFPLQFEQLFPHLKRSNIDVHDHNHKKRRPNRRIYNQRQNQKIKPKIMVTIESTTPVSTMADTLATMSKITTSDPAEPNTGIPGETTTFVTTTIASENNLDVNNFLTDDYYPNFATDNNYFDSEEIQIIRNHRDNRYHYTTDKNNEFEITRDGSVENVLIKPINNDDEQEIAIFRTPPFLERPDFRTRQVKKEKPRANQYKDITFEKSSTYSDIKTPPTKDVKGRLEKSKKTKTDIETVFAHSKVIKYGKNDNVDEENEIPIVTYYIPDNMQYEEDGKSVVIAKSIPPDYFW